ncbi:MAG: hypothetical protein OXR64_07200 [Chloroflexota bacterium]|nr:hypothetical protein [Chloroflexota bacterium]MDE2919620.1 hypothetical protein [Chloroflexota bacterium]
MHRSHKHQRALPYWQQRRNALIAPVRYLGLARNAVELWFKCLAYNLRRAARLHGLAGA